jgi:two-component system, cell cycle sensor histidine kinase and response regulator CckA
MSELLRVLQIEDSEGDAAMIVRALEKARYQVEGVRVEDAAGMRAALAERAWDVIIADYHLPQFDAPAALRILRDSGRDIPFIVVSAVIGEDTAVAMMRSGAHDYLLKDKLARLGPAVDRELRDAESRRERRRAEEALAASEARFRALLESAPQGVIAVDEQGHIALVNVKTEEMFGYSRDELFGGPLDILLLERYRVAHSEHQRQYFAHSRTRLMGLGLDLWGRRKNGSEFPLEISLSFVEQGGTQLALALITDITDRKKAEEHLRQAQKLESIGMLAGGIAHDFNNLLVGVIGNASLAQDLLPRGSPAGELLDAVVKTGEQAAHLTRQMLAYAGKGQFVVEPLNLSDLFPEMTGLVQPSISKKIALHLDLDPDLPYIEADRGQMQQVFMNLVLNAAEAIGSDAGMISVKTRVQNVDEPYIRRNLETELSPGRYVILEARDTGCGMDDATRARMFDPFFSTKFQGRGLGLAAVAGIVRGHKGAISVSSAPGKGACFTVLFPATEGAAAVAQVGARNVSIHGTGTILVVDDEQGVRNLVRRVLEQYGYKVLLADGGAAAINTFKRHPGDISLVVLDASMPGMSGAETLPELRKIRPEVKILVSSGYSELETMKDFPGPRVTGFIQKPYTSSGLAEKVRSAMA